MPDVSTEKSRQLIKVCSYYYNDSLSQQEISDKMGISRSQVSRMLTQAKSSGIVTITIKNPFSEEQKYENWLAQKFHLLDAIVLDVDGGDRYELNQRLAIVMSDLLNAALKDHTVFGVMAGMSINSISEDIAHIERVGLRAVPLVGGVGSRGRWQANLNAKNFSDKLNCEFIALNAPLIVSSPEMREALVKESDIAEVLQMGQESTTALVGIGQISPSATIFNTGVFTSAEIGELISKGAVASVCGSFLDKDGHPVDFSAYPRMVGLNVEQLKKIPKVIGVAWGTEKAPAITATLRGRWIDILVTTVATARAIMDCCSEDGSAEKL